MKIEPIARTIIKRNTKTPNEHAIMLHPLRWFYSLSMTQFSLFIITLLATVLAALTPASSSAFNVLPKEQAFVISTSQDDGIQATWQIAESCYLYQKFIALRVLDSNENVLAELQPLAWPEAITKDDPEFGIVQTYFKSLTLDFDTAPLAALAADVKQGALLEFRFQGCLENVLCYPPQRIIEPLMLQTTSTNNANINTTTTAKTNATTNATPDTPAPSTQAPSTQAPPENSNLFAILSAVNANEIAQWIQTHSLPAQLVIFLTFGLLLAFTPCVLPMVPILAGIILNDAKKAAQHTSQQLTRRALSLSAAYVVGIVCVYALLGLIFGLLSQQFNLIALLQHPIAQLLTAGIFVLLALSMFGVYELKLPQAIEQRLQQKQQTLSGGQLSSSFGLGAISALVLSPCVTAPLAGALLFVSTSNNIFHGMLILATLALGMGLPLLLVSTFGVNAIPKSGQWMNIIKHFFGLLLLAVGVWVARAVIGSTAFHSIMALLLMGFAIHLLLQRRHFTKAWAINLFAFIIFGLGAWQATQAYKNLTNDTIASVRYYDTAVSSHAALKAAIAAADKPVIVDFYADWCISCEHLIRNVFSQDAAQTAMRDYHFIKIDLSDVTGQALNDVLTDYNIIGLPAVLFFDDNKQEILNARISGELSLDAFLTHLQTLNP